MHGFLVVARTTLDDICLQLYPTWEEAVEFVRALKPADVFAEADDFSVHVSEVIGVVIVEFRDGAPMARKDAAEFLGEGFWDSARRRQPCRCEPRQPRRRKGRG